MVRAGMYQIDILKPYILWSFGGLIMDLDYKVVSSTRVLHKIMDSYSNLNTPNRIDLSSQFVAAKLKHPAVKAWREFVTEYYGFESEFKFGVLDILPMPTFF